MSKVLKVIGAALVIGVTALAVGVGHTLYTGVRTIYTGNITVEAQGLRQQVQVLKLEKEIEEIKRAKQQDAIEYQLKAAKLQSKEKLISSGMVAKSREVGTSIVYLVPLWVLSGLVTLAWLFAYSKKKETEKDIKVAESTALMTQAQTHAEVFKTIAPHMARTMASGFAGLMKQQQQFYAQQIQAQQAQLALPGMKSAEPATLSLPTFQQIVENLEPGDDMYFGTNIATREAITGTFDDLYSSFFAGESGSGKSSWLRGIIAQSLVTCPGVEYHILDPHGKRKDSLSASLPKTEQFVFLNRTDPTPGMLDFNGLLQDRIDAPEETMFPPLVLVCDELSYCSKQRYAGALQILFDRIATEGRKVFVYLLVSSQDTRQKKGLDFRDCLASSYVFRLKTKQASYLLQDKEETEKHKAVKAKGRALLNLTSGDSQIVQVPYCSPADMYYFDRNFLQGNGPTITITNAETTIQTETPHDELRKRVREYIDTTKDMSQNKFADATGISRKNMSYILNGKRDPLLDEITAIETALTFSPKPVSLEKFREQRKQGNTLENQGETERK